MLPSEAEFPYAIRAVSETFESNGSTSQASVCASSMALMAAGVPVKKPVAGISCGLVTGDTDDDYLVLTDIQDWKTSSETWTLRWREPTTESPPSRWTSRSTA